MKGNGRSDTLDYHEAPKRVVSLVPSTTDSLYQLGAGQALVGVTEYCPVPVAVEKQPAVVGGTKNADLQLIIDLKPDLIIANQEENEKETIEKLEELGQPVWLTFPRSVNDALNILYTLVRLFRLNHAFHRIRTLELTLEWAARAAPADMLRVFCPVWYEPEGELGPWWMVANHDTYHFDILLACNGRGIFGERLRQYPLAADLGAAEAEPAGERDQRYPRVTIEEVVERDPEVILLPSEPYLFGEGHLSLVKDLLPESKAVKNGRVHLVDGRLLSWHGTRMATALAELPQLLERGRPSKQ
jgi:ABC-type Fe3+-hydroxamate transport system substrate-binding protein